MPDDAGVQDIGPKWVMKHGGEERNNIARRARLALLSGNEIVELKVKSIGGFVDGPCRGV